jgi:hypothetical protein
MVEPEERTSQLAKKGTHTFRRNMKTVWRPGKVLKSWAKAAMLGIVLIPTIIIE